MIWTADSPFEKSKEMSRSGIIRWWEIHRIRYNVLVGLTGLVTLSLVIFVGPLAVKPGVDFEEPMGLIALPIAFGVMANLCYTAGWIVDIVFYRRTPRYKLFRIGLMFSILVASLPGLWAVAAWFITLCTGKKLD